MGFFTSPCSRRGSVAQVPGRRAAGFTLLELLVVLAISSLLALIAYPSYRESVIRSRRAQGRAALAAAMLDQERRFTASNAYQVFSATSPNRFKWHSGETPATSAYELYARACDATTIASCVLITASPGTGRVNSGYQDPDCGQLTLDSQGQQGASGPGPGCW